MTDKTYAHVLDGTVRELLTLNADLVLGQDIFTEEAAKNFVDVTSVSPQPAESWTTTDGKTFAAPVAPVLVPAVRSVQGAVLIHTLDKATKVSPRDLAYVAGLTAAREDMASLARIAAVDGLTPKSWFDAALGVTA